MKRQKTEVHLARNRRKSDVRNNLKKKLAAAEETILAQQDEIKLLKLVPVTLEAQMADLEKRMKELTQEKNRFETKYKNEHTRVVALIPFKTFVEKSFPSDKKEEDGLRPSSDVSNGTILQLNNGPWRGFKNPKGKIAELRQVLEFDIKKHFGQHGRFSNGRGLKIMDFDYPTKDQTDLYQVYENLQELREDKKGWAKLYDPSEKSQFSENDLNEFLNNCKKKYTEKNQRGVPFEKLGLNWFVPKFHLAPKKELQLLPVRRLDTARTFPRKHRPQ